jgi:hypothetical protein
LGDRAVQKFSSDGAIEENVVIPVDESTVAVRIARVRSAAD